MQQGVPEFAYSEDTLRLRQFLYERWCADGRGPNLREVHEGLGLPREAIVAAYKQLQMGNMVVLDPTSQNFNVWKMLPFSSFPSQVRVYLDGRFHSYAGCAMESVAIARMPPFHGQGGDAGVVLLVLPRAGDRGHARGDVVGRHPESVLIHVSMNPYDWGIPTLMAMCDSMNYVHDADHAEAYERMIGRRGCCSPSTRPPRWSPVWPTSGCGTTTGPITP